MKRADYERLKGSLGTCAWLRGSFLVRQRVDQVALVVLVSYLAFTLPPGSTADSTTPQPSFKQTGEHVTWDWDITDWSEGNMTTDGSWTSKATRWPSGTASTRADSTVSKAAGTGPRSEGTIARAVTTLSQNGTPTTTGTSITTEDIMLENITSLDLALAEIGENITIEPSNFTDNNTDPCDPSPCFPGGICYPERTSGFYCKCGVRYGGADCTVDKYIILLATSESSQTELQEAISRIEYLTTIVNVVITMLSCMTLCILTLWLGWLLEKPVRSLATIRREELSKVFVWRKAGEKSHQLVTNPAFVEGAPVIVLDPPRDSETEVDDSTTEESGTVRSLGDTEAELVGWQENGVAKVEGGSELPQIYNSPDLPEVHKNMESSQREETFSNQAVNGGDIQG